VRSRFYIPVSEWSTCGKQGHVTPLCVLGDHAAAVEFCSKHRGACRLWYCDMSPRARRYVESLVTLTRPPWHHDIYGRAPLSNYNLAYAIIGPDNLLHSLHVSAKEARYSIDANHHMVRFRTASMVTEGVRLGISQEVAIVEEWRE